jgi:gliding motility-associated-like protein
MKNRKKILSLAKLCCLFFLLISSTSYSQQATSKTATLKTVNRSHTDMFGVQGEYIENIGQYGDIMAGYTYMGKILYGYEGLEMPVLFTSKGLIHLHRSTKTTSYKEKRKEERRKLKTGKTENKKEMVDQTITMEWLNANPNPVIITEKPTSAYHTYGMLGKKAKGFKKIIYKNLYPGIDAEYTFRPGNKVGFEYILLVNPGADISRVKMKYGGDVKKIEQDKNGNLVIRSSVDGILQSAPIGYLINTNATKAEDANVHFSQTNNVISFKLSEGYNKAKTLVIDPFVSSTNSLTGTNTSKAKDIDFDYAGNIYVSGGGDISFQKLAKFDASGLLLWTFSGSLAMPVWIFGGSYGGWVVEKNTGMIYLGQGLSGSGFSIIRLTSAGLYDNYITTPNTNFGENWRMIYSCHGGIAKMMIAGGGGSANNELALLSPPSIVPAISNISGLTGGHNDISDIVIDPLTDEMYTIFSTSIFSAGGDNIIYKHLPPYSSATKVWSTPTQFFALQEPLNRPYMNGFDNSSNTLGINSSFLFYWDGKNLKAINKATGASAGSPLTIAANELLKQGGIFADECNNVFVGSANGTIKVFKFNGNTFDDDAVADITITGFSTKAVYDLAYDNDKKLLYVSGDGFVASYDVSSYCPSTIYAVSIVPDCSGLSATVNITPAPPAGTTITYALYNGSTNVASNTTGVFQNLTININYTVKAFLNQACGGTQATGNFIITDPPVLSMHNPATICVPEEIDLTAPNITAGSSPGLAFTYWKDLAASIPYPTPANASAGTYYIKGTAISGCSNIAPVVVNTFPVPIADAGNDVTICFGNNIQLNGSGGLVYSWTPIEKLNNPNISSPVVTRPNAGKNIYYLKVIDINGCESQIDGQVTITVITPTKLFIGNDTAIAINQPLQLNAIDVNSSGLINYIWTPSYGLDNRHIPNPVAILDKDITYILNATTASDCKATAAIRVKVYKGPEIYVPTAFTPGGNGLNDVLRAIPVGIKTFNYFSIFNRYGQLVFTTADPRKGWDGKINSVEQGSNVFVWMAEAIDYKGNLIRRKGTCTIIR